MLKSSSLCLYSSNFGTFWLKIEQFWLFEEISIFSNGGHLGYRTAMTDTILKGDHPRIISAKFGSVVSEKILIKISSPLFSIFSLAAILVGSWDHRTQFWKGAIQGSFHKSLVAIGPVVSEEKIYLCEFPIGSYVKLSSAVGAILIEGSNRRTQFWKRTIQ